MSDLISSLAKTGTETLVSVFDLLSEWWVILLILAALCHAIVEFIDEHVLDRLQGELFSENATGTLTIISGFFGIVISVLFLIYTVFSHSFQLLLIENSYVAIALFAGMLEVIWMIPYLNAIHKGGAINASPLFQLIPVFSLILGLFIFGEVPSKWHLLGGLTIVVGAFILNCHAGTFRLDRKTVYLMSLATFLISVVYFLFKEVVVSENFVAAAFWSGVGMTVMSILLWKGYKPYRDEFDAFLTSSKQKAILWQTSNEGINAVGTLLTHLAVARAPSVMLAASMNAFHPIFTLLIGWTLGKNGSEKHAKALRESEFYKKLISVALLATGTILIALN